MRLSLYDISGRRVRTLLEGLAGEGAHELVWSGRDDAGRSVAAGVYWVRLETEEGARSTQLIRLR